MIKIEHLAEKGSNITNADLNQQLNWSGDGLMVPNRRASRSLSPKSGPAASSTRRSTLGVSGKMKMPLIVD